MVQRLGVLALLACGALPLSALAQQTIPQPIAEIVINRHLANRLADQCSAFEVDSRKANDILKSALSKQKDMPFSKNGFNALEDRVGPALLFAAEGVYFEQVEVFVFDRRSACIAANKAIEEQQAVGEFLRFKSSCRRASASCYFAQ